MKFEKRASGISLHQTSSLKCKHPFETSVSKFSKNSSHILREILTKRLTGLRELDKEYHLNQMRTIVLRIS